MPIFEVGPAFLARALLVAAGNWEMLFRSPVKSGHTMAIQRNVRRSNPAAGSHRASVDPRKLNHLWLSCPRLTSSPLLTVTRVYGGIRAWIQSTTKNKICMLNFLKINLRLSRKNRIKGARNTDTKFKSPPNLHGSLSLKPCFHGCNTVTKPAGAERSCPIYTQDNSHI